MPMQIASDDFNRANSSTLGSNWSSGPSSIAFAATPQTLSNRAYNEGSEDCDAFYGASSFDNNQYSQATITSINSGTNDFSGVIVRGSATDEIIFQIDKNGAQFKLLWYNSGAYTSLGSYSATPVVNDVLRLECVGTTFYAYVNGVLRITGSNAGAPSSGKPGIMVSGSNADQSSVDNWSGGNLVNAANISWFTA